MVLTLVFPVLVVSVGIGSADIAGRFIVMLELDKEVNFLRAAVKDSDLGPRLPSC